MTQNLISNNFYLVHRAENYFLEHFWAREWVDCRVFYGRPTCASLVLGVLTVRILSRYVHAAGFSGAKHPVSGPKTPFFGKNHFWIVYEFEKNS